MKKNIKGRKLSRSTNERKQLFRNLVRSLTMHGFVETSEAKAKAVRPLFEKLVTRGKKNSLTNFRRVLSEVGEVATAQNIMKLGSLFAKRPGGYTRLIKMGYQEGDNTQVVRLELVEKLVTAEVVSPPAVKKLQVANATSKVPVEKTVKETKSIKPQRIKKTPKAKKA